MTIVIPMTRSHLIHIDNPSVVIPERPMVDTSFWDPSLESVQQASRDECLAKHVFRHACLDAYGKAVPVALKKLNGKLVALATDDILPGGLVIPVLCFRDSSIHTPSSIGYHSKDGVFGSVKWKQPVDESSVRDVEIKLGCQPERRQPPQKDKMQKPDYDIHTDCHPHIVWVSLTPR